MAAIAFAYISGLWLYSVPLTGDQKVYVSTAMEMWQNKVWLYPILMGEHIYVKPPIQLWATLAGWNIFGFNPFGTYFPSVAALLGTCWFLEQISKKIAPRKDPATASLWFAGTFGTMTYACVAQMDIWLVFLFTGAWWGAINYFYSYKARYVYFAFALAGLCAMVKGPLHSVLWSLGLLLFISFPGQRKPWKDPQIYIALIFGVALSLVWFVTVYITDYQAFWVSYVRNETLAKSSGNNGPLLNMWRDFFISLSPWCLFILISVFVGIKKWGLSNVRTRLLLSWCLPAMIFFSLFPYRTETYLFVAVPAFALMADWISCEKWPESRRWLLRGVIQTNALLVAFGVFLVGAIFVLSHMVSVVWIFFLVLSGLAASALFFKNNVRPALFATLVLVMVVRLSAASLGEDDVAGLREFIRLYPDRNLVYEDIGKNWWNEIGLLSLAARKPSVRIMKENEIFQELLKGSALVLSNDQWPNWIPKLRLRFRKNPGKGSLEVYSWWRWNRGFLFPKWNEIRLMADRRSPEWTAKFRREFKIIYLRLN